MKSNNKKAGIIGTNWGLMHLDGLREAGVDIISICGTKLEKTKKIASKENIPHATTNVADLYEKCDIIVVASPDNMHFQHIKQALQAGCHVLAEKPITRTYSDAKKLINFFNKKIDENQQFCTVNFPYRMMSPFIKLDNWIMDHSEPEMLSVTVNNGFADAEGRFEKGPLMGKSGDFGGISHVIDAALWLMKEKPIWIQAKLIGRPPYTVLMHIGLKNNAIISIQHIATHRPGIDGKWFLYGKNWEAKINAAYDSTVNAWHAGPAQVYNKKWQLISEKIDKNNCPNEPWANAIIETAKQLVKSIETGNRSSHLATFHDAVLVQQIVNAAIESEKKNKKIKL